MDPLIPEGTRQASRLAAARTALATNAEGGETRDVSTDDGWHYRMLPDGNIKILAAPEGHKSGATLSGGPAYDAVRGLFEDAEASAEPPLQNDVLADMDNRVADAGDQFDIAENEMMAAEAAPVPADPALAADPMAPPPAGPEDERQSFIEMLKAASGGR
jgi:hypothetical protein